MVFLGILITTLGIMSGINLRKHEFGILKAIGWTTSELKKYLVKETLLYCMAGALLGIAIAYVIAALLGSISMNIPIPWELSSATPHFLMENSDEKIIMPIKLNINISMALIAFTLTGTAVAGIAMGFLSANKISKIKPSEAIRNVG